MWHHRFRNDVARIVEMPDMPFVRILVAETRQIRTSPLRSPQHRMIVFGFDGKRIRPVALDLVAQRPDHLRVTGVATLADVDVASRDLERCIDAHVWRIFHSLVNGEKRRDLDGTTDAGDANDGEQETNGLALETVMQSEHSRHSPG